MRTRLALLALPLLVLGCQPTNAPELPDWTPTLPTDAGPTGNVTNPDDPEALEGVITITPLLEFEGRFGLASDNEQPCSYDTTNGYGQTRCRLDANELDLFFHGWGYNALVEAQTCTYLGLHNYIYQAWEVGDGPEIVEYNVDPVNGQITDVQNSINGQPACAFDHALRTGDDEAPNCCYGFYTLRVNVGGVTTEAGPYAWGGGDIGECYGGAGYYSNITQLLDNGVPARIIVDVDEDVNTTTTVTFDGPIERLEANSVPVANYLNGEDPIPVAYQGEWSVPDYRIDCMDDAEEFLASFFIEVREWDTVAEFEKDEAGNPDIGQGIPAPLEVNGESPLNDRWDWRDFGNAGIDWVQFAD